MRKPKFTEEQLDFIRTLSGLSRKDQRDIFDLKYGTKTNYHTFKDHMQRRGIEASGDGRFKKGCEPWNKGMSVEEYRTHFTDEEWYEMTHRVLDAPHKRCKVGDVVVITDCHGFTQPWIYIRNGKNLTTYERITQLDRFIWEKKVGPIPEGYIIFHLNGNHLDCRVDNLACIPNGYITTLTRWMRSEFSEVNKTTIAYLDLMAALKKFNKEKEC